jgi:isopenicillin N synthase-like dioxygenase
MPQSPRLSRDLLPFRLQQDHFTRALDETYERGFFVGRAAGLELALKVLRDANIANIGDILQTLTNEKYREKL